MPAGGLGLAVVISTSATALLVIKWAGVAYLIWRGIRMIRRAKRDDPRGNAGQAGASLRTLWMQGFLTSSANPKGCRVGYDLVSAVISAGAPFWPQFLILSAT